jgi:putative PEP-CTERM system integral membrane protein
MDNPLPTPPKSYTWLEWIQFGLFWSWNLIFLAFMSFGFAPIILPETFTAVRTGTIPATFLAYALVLAMIPVATVILGLTMLRNSPSRLFALGYVIEGPLMLMLAVRFFAIRQATQGTILPMSIALLGMAAFLWYLLDPRTGSRHPATEYLRLAGLTLMALTSLYAAAWIAFYALPLGVEGLRWLNDTLSNLPRIFGDLVRSLRDMFINSPLMLPFSLLGFVLLLYTATLLVLTPIAVPYLSLRAWWRTLNQQVGQLGWSRPTLLVGGVIAASAVLVFLANRQPQAQAFALLEEPPTSTENAQALLDRSDQIRAGLLNAYLAPYRYISAEGEVRHVSDIYASTFDMPRQKPITCSACAKALPARCFTSRCNALIQPIRWITTPWLNSPRRPLNCTSASSTRPTSRHKAPPSCTPCVTPGRPARQRQPGRPSTIAKCTYCARSSPCKSMATGLMWSCTKPTRTRLPNCRR